VWSCLAGDRKAAELSSTSLCANRALGISVLLAHQSISWWPGGIVNVVRDYGAVIGEVVD
jgi:hypothetical protein